MNPGAERSDHDIGDSEVHDEVIGRCMHPFVPPDNVDDERVADQRQPDDDAVEGDFNDDLEQTWVKTRPQIHHLTEIEGRLGVEGLDGAGDVRRRPRLRGVDDGGHWGGVVIQGKGTEEEHV